MSTRTWHKGPPPFPGWWNANRSGRLDLLRWHDGQAWSYPAEPYYSMQRVMAAASRIDPYQASIEWTDYWPENARVPRVDPRSKT